MILSRAEASKPEQLESLSSKSGPVKEFLHKKILIMFMEKKKII